MLFVGIDPSAAPSQPSACAAMDESGEVVSVVCLGADEEILAWLRGFRQVWAVGVDGPLALPVSLSRRDLVGPPEASQSLPSGAERRSSEIELTRRGIGCFFTTRRSFARPWVLRCLDLGAALAAQGYRVLEVYPYATKVRLWGKNHPRPKQRLAARSWMLDAVRRLGLEWQTTCLPSHDELDAVLAALTVFLARQGLVEELGQPDDGTIFIPSGGKDLLNLIRALWLKT